jgi:hypothetical protein
VRARQAEGQLPGVWGSELVRARQAEDVCRERGGPGLCEHNRQKHQCLECGGVRKTDEHAGDVRETGGFETVTGEPGVVAATVERVGLSVTTLIPPACVFSLPPPVLPPKLLPFSPTHVSIHIYLCIDVYRYIHLCIYVCIHVYKLTSIHTYVCMYI